MTNIKILLPSWKSPLSNITITIIVITWSSFLINDLLRTTEPKAHKSGVMFWLMCCSAFINKAPHHIKSNIAAHYHRLVWSVPPLGWSGVNESALPTPCLLKMLTRFVWCVVLLCLDGIISHHAKRASRLMFWSDIWLFWGHSRSLTLAIATPVIYIQG